MKHTHKSNIATTHRYILGDFIVYLCTSKWYVLLQSEYKCMYIMARYLTQWRNDGHSIGQLCVQ